MDRSGKMIGQQISEACARNADGDAVSMVVQAYVGDRKTLRTTPKRSLAHDPAEAV